MKIGDRVKPVESFNFETFTGPKNLEDRGTVVQGPDNGIWVEWDSATDMSDHAVEGDGDYSFKNFGVVLADVA